MISQRTGEIIIVVIIILLNIWSWTDHYPSARYQVDVHESQLQGEP